MLLLGDKVQFAILGESRCRPFSLKLENHDTIVVARSEEIDLRMSSDDPESIVFALERLHRGALVEIPYANRLVLAH